MALTPHMVHNNGHICMRSASPQHIFYKLPSLTGTVMATSGNTYFRSSYTRGRVVNNTQADELNGAAMAHADSGDYSISWGASFTALPMTHGVNAQWSYGSDPTIAAAPLSSHNQIYYCNYDRMLVMIDMAQFFNNADPQKRGDSTLSDWKAASVNISLTAFATNWGIGLCQQNNVNNPNNSGTFAFHGGITASWCGTFFPQITSLSQVHAAPTWYPRATVANPAAVLSTNSPGYSWWYDPTPDDFNRASFRSDGPAGRLQWGGAASGLTIGDTFVVL